MQLPLLTSPQTAMSEEAGPYSFDIDLENETTLDGLWAWYQAIDGEAFAAYSEQYLKQVFEAQDAFYDRLGQVLTEK